MSQLEVAKETSPIYSYTFLAMGAGTIESSNVVGNANVIANFKPGCSRVLGVQLVTAGGTVGTPYINNLGAIANSIPDGFIPVLQIRSSSDADTSVYKVYWTNEVTQSKLLTIIAC